MIYFIEQNNWNALHDTIDNLKPTSITIIVDNNTAKFCLPLLEFTDVNIVKIPDGEAHKNIETVQSIWQRLLQYGVDRHGLIINLGGGMVTDIGGFAASTYKRGLSFIHIPTTLLAMVDAAIGGKNGINFESYKNQIGTIVQPEAVFINPLFLNTLPENQLMSGIAEMIKHALIAKPAHFKQIIDSPLSLEHYLIAESAKIKEKIVQSDPYEKGLRKILNFGHTFGHALEAWYQSTRTSLTHGHAVALGMIAETYLSSLKTGLNSNEARKIIEEIVRLYPVPDNLPAVDDLLSFMFHDKKNRNGKILSVLLKQTGQPVIDIMISEKDIEAALTKLHRLKKRRPV